MKLKLIKDKNNSKKDISLEKLSSIITKDINGRLDELSNKVLKLEEEKKESLETLNKEKNTFKLIPTISDAIQKDSELPNGFIYVNQEGKIKVKIKNKFHELY